MIFIRFVFPSFQDSRVARDDYSASYSDNSLGLTSGYDYNPKPEYGPPPSTSYGAPSYGPPTSYYPSAPGSYGAPKPINMYNYAGPPHAYNLPGEHWLLDKLKFKLDLFTIGKILLKLIIFKKIIKFIALICLLLFLPKLQSKHMKMEDLVGSNDEDDDDDDRRRQFGGHCKYKRVLSLPSFLTKTKNKKYHRGVMYLFRSATTNNNKVAKR